MIDLHAHILPNLDDGPASLELARLAVAAGITTVVATPHMPIVAPEIRDLALRALRVALKAHGIPLEILPGGEYRLDDQMLARAAATPGYFLGQGRSLLAELPSRLHLNLLEPLLYQAQLKEIGLVLAHAERHPEVAGNLKLLRTLVERGLVLQVNADAVLGVDFAEWNRTAKKLVGEGLAGVVASDMHDPVHRPPRLGDARAVLEKWVGSAAAKKLTSDTPAHLLGIP